MEQYANYTCDRCREWNTTTTLLAIGYLCKSCRQAQFRPPIPMAVAERSVLEETSDESSLAATMALVDKLDKAVQQASTPEESTVALNLLVENRRLIGEKDYQRLVEIALNYP